MYDVVVKKSTFAISSPDELLFIMDVSLAALLLLLFARWRFVAICMNTSFIDFA